MLYVDLQRNNSKKHTHTTAGTAEKVTGFTERSFVRVCAHVAIAYVGLSKEDAEKHGIAVPLNTDLIIRIPNGQSHVWVDTGTNGSIVSLVEMQVAGG